MKVIVGVNNSLSYVFDATAKTLAITGDINLALRLPFSVVNTTLGVAMPLTMAPYPTVSGTTYTYAYTDLPEGVLNTDDLVITYDLPAAQAETLAEQLNPTSGIATLISGSVTVDTNKITATTLLHLSYHTTAGGIGILIQSNLVPGVSFDIKSWIYDTAGGAGITLNTDDVSMVYWMILKN